MRPSPTLEVMEESPLKKRHILIVDDDLSLRKLLTEVLQREYEVETLPSGLHLPEVLNGNPPDLIILDVMLPWKNGFDICRSVKSHSGWKNIPVLFLSGRRKTEDFQMGAEMGADAYLTKPFIVKDLLNKISELLAH